MVCFQESISMETCLPNCCLAATRNLSNLVDKFTDWEQFQSLASELISPRIKINSGKEADKVACNFTAAIASVYRLSTSRITLSDTHLFNHCLRLSHFPKPWKEAKFIMLPKPGMDPKFPQNLCSISLLSTTGKLFEEVILEIVQMHI
jgi:hypothetical protein